MTSIQDDKAWFLAQLKPNCAKIAEKNLTRQGFETFLPLEEETRQRNGKFTTAMRPLFPGYMFVSFDVGRGHWRAIKSTNGITRLVSFGKEPKPVPTELVKQLRQRCDPTGRPVPLEGLVAGDQVTLTHGPFANFVAEVEKIAPDRRVWVLMDIMGGQQRVGVAPEQLRKV